MAPRARIVLLAAAAAIAASASAAVPATPDRSIAEVLASPGRTAEDRARDRRDKPAEVLAFFGVRPGMRVFDLSAATGYYTELLARAVGPSGHVIAHNDPGALKILGAARIGERYRDGRLPQVELMMARHGELKLPPHSLDLVMMSMVYHDTYWYSPKVDYGPVDRPALLRVFYEALRPGGVVGVIDNVAAAGSDPVDSVMKLHRIDPEVIRRDFQRAGFVLDGESAVLRKRDDDHRLGVFDPAIKGRTDRMVMRFRKRDG
jgi:predicted methyltransferase